MGQGNEDELNREAQADNVAEATSATEGEPEVVEAVVEGELEEGATGSAELEGLQAELKEAKDQVLRAHAEMQNVRRRSEQDVEKARKFALERFARELLPIVDSLEKALEASAEGESGEQQVQSIREGVDMTLSLMVSALGKAEIQAVEPMNQPFNPELHEAMSMVPQADVEPNTVIAVLQKGYTLNGRLIRPAMVMVSKAP